MSAIFKVDTDSYKAALVDGKRPDMVEHNGVMYRIHDIRRKGAYKKDRNCLQEIESGGIYSLQ